VFAIVRLIPGDPARLLAGDFATDQIVDELRHKWRLDDQCPVQYAAYLRGIVGGDLGRSITTSTPILPELTERFLRTLELAVAAILVAIVVGGAAGIASAVRRSSLTDYAATTRPLDEFFTSTPDARPFNVDGSGVAANPFVPLPGARPAADPRHGIYSFTKPDATDPRITGAATWRQVKGSAPPRVSVP